MSERVEYRIEAHIDNTPEAVIEYVADCRHRPLFVPSLKSITNVEGEPSAEGTTWEWTFATLGLEVSGRGRCTAHEPGRRYALVTEDGIESTFTYTAEPEGDGTKLTVDLEYTLPDGIVSKLPGRDVRERARKSEADAAVHNLKVILDR